MMLLDRIDAVARTNSRDIAISCPVAGDISFEMLLGGSALLREQLERAGIEPGSRVAIFGHRSAGVVVAMHAVLSALCAYVPIFHGTPLNRLKRILEDCQPAAIICDGRCEPTAIKAISDLNLEVGLIRLDPESIRDASSTLTGLAPSNDLQPESDFSVLYTSGSTGTPKGVMLTHGNLSHYIDWATEHFELSSNDVVFSTAPFHFDMSSFDIFGALSTGARLVIASEKECLFPKVLVKRLREERATVWKAVAPLLANVARTLDLSEVHLPVLRCLIFSGDRIPVEELGVWMSALPHVTYFNAYGPTEATGVSCCYKLPAPVTPGDLVPIGRGRFEGEVEIFDDEERVTTAARKGEIVISGRGIASGYWGDSAKTEASFLQRIGAHEFQSRAYRTGDTGYYDAHGNIVFVGRVDRQIKHQGYRIELDEIEVTLRQMGGVTDAAVVLVPEGAHKGLAAFYETDTEIDAVDIRAKLSTRLPGYMVPRLIRRVASLPRGDRGKIDYVSLAEVR